MVPVLSQPQAEQDRLPTVDGAEIDLVDADSARYLGSSEEADYWVGLEGGEICLVQLLSEAEIEVAGASCTTAERLAEGGLAVSTGTAGTSATGLLVPEGFDLADAEHEEDWVAVGDHLAVPADEAGRGASSG
ncbi:hypothetical protein [Kineococcus arenarius]|uniref:hypothetical protein n=1 Tax=Kineococcus sp. SYSU DK021 TaxID=3383142 RepID=UPI003D7DF872